MPLALLYLAVFAGGVLTILSPCILPVLPFVFARTDRSFLRESLPLLAGMALTFVAVALAGTGTAAWLVTIADSGRWIALVVLALAGLALLSPRISAWLSRPVVRAGARLVQQVERGDRTSQWSAPSRSLALGVATGLLWAPCAGPILGLVIGVAIASAAPAVTVSLLAVFAAGAAASLAFAILGGSRLMSTLRPTGGGSVDRWLRPALGVATLASVLLLAFGWDAPLLANSAVVATAGAEESVLRTLVPDRRSMIASLGARHEAPIATPDEGPLPTFAGASGWLNTPRGEALVPADYRGKVVVVNVWTFACYNCLNALPHIKDLARKYAGRDVVVIGVHTPELARERVPRNVEDAVRRLGVTYPIAIDADYRIWRAFDNQYWPSVYIADRNGRIRFHHFGEGRYEDEDRVVSQLLTEPAP